MNPIVITVVFAVALALVLVVVALRREKQISGLQDVESQWRKVDMESFLNLTDPAEERFLRRNLPATEFRRIERERIGVMCEYLGRLAFNSKLMMRAGQMVQHSSSGQNLQEATQLVSTAARIRLLIFMAEATLAFRFLMPTVEYSMTRLVADYDSLTRMFASTCGETPVAARSLAG
jgi:hypothetical protein